MRIPYLLLLLSLCTITSAQVTPDPFSMLKYRCIGPHRGGRTVGAVGVPQQPGVFYIGVNNGGVWKTDDYGRTWNPIFDDQPTGSIGDIAVAPSDPKIIYVASGEGIQRPDLSVGDGVYKSSDGGKTWVNTGLKDGQQIGGLAIDPKNSDIVFAAVLGHPYGPNAERGVFRTTNGGKTWEKVKYINENAGAIQVTIDPNNAQIIYADFFESRLFPWENGRAMGNNSGLWKSTDGGTTWRAINKGLPTPKDGLGRIGFCIAPSNSNRLYATVDCGEYTPTEKNGGIFRSDDAGESWYRTNADPRLWGRGDDFGEIKCDPKNADIVYSADVATWKSVDGGKTFLCWRGAPGGDDYHRIWIHPNDPNLILLASDQGAIITVNGGRTFSSWYNQPTAQFYHVSTDNAFPYNVYGGQQESGSACVSSRGNDGLISYREWRPIGAEEWGYVAADPLDPTIIYGGKLTRFDKKTGQNQNIMPEAIRSGKYRFIRTAPVLFSPIDPKVLYFAGNVLFRTRNGGHSWEVISPDLSRGTKEIPESVGIYKAEAEQNKPGQRGVIYTVAPSPLDSNLIWCGTDDGKIQVTKDGGKTWLDNLTPAGIQEWQKVSLMEAGHFNAKEAFAAVNAIRKDDLRPHIWHTSNSGETWTEITKGLPENEPINAIREDPKQPGLLFAGSEHSVHVSFDNGAHWQSLRLNMPATSIRDLVIKDDDLVLGTHGRSFWILDNINPLRAIAKSVAVYQKAPVEGLFPVPDAYRVRWSMYTDTPIPQEEPVGQNPPDGAILDYYLTQTAQSVLLEILDAKGTIIRTITQNETATDVSKVNFPLYWIRPFQALSGKKGAHRFCWDLREGNAPKTAPSFPISAVYGQTTPNSIQPWVLPGNYTIRLTIDGKKYEQPLLLRMDPRVKTSNADLQKLHDLNLKCVQTMQLAHEIQTNLATTQNMLTQVATVDATTKKGLTDINQNFDQLQQRSNAIAETAETLAQLLQETDETPTMQTTTSVEMLEATAKVLSNDFSTLIKTHKKILVQNKALVSKNQEKTEKAALIYTNSHPQQSEIDAFFTPLYSADLSNTIAPKGIWSVTPAGELTATEDQCIWSKEKYNDFVLDLEFKTAEGTNSGVIFHCSDTDNWIPNALEVQIADDYAKQWAEADPTWQCGAVFGHLAASKRTVKRAGEWNHYTISAKGREIWVVLNGELINHMDMSQWLSGSTNPDGSAIPSWMWKPFAVLPLEGHIGFQGKHAGAPIWFRNIKVKKL